MNGLVCGAKAEQIAATIDVRLGLVAAVPVSHEQGRARRGCACCRGTWGSRSRIVVSYKQSPLGLDFA